MFKPPALDQLPLVHELNRAFLGLLQTRVRGQRDCFGLPFIGHPALLTAPAALLDGVACFPRALFRLDLGGRSRSACAEVDRHFDEAQRELCLSILFATRAASRHSAFQARLLFDLDAADVERLGAARLADLQRLACEPFILECAFREWPWFWQGLFPVIRPELRRQLALMALQPRVADWPQRRPPQPTA